LGVEKEESKAVLLVVSDRRGEVCSAGAMVRTVVAVGFSHVWLLTEREEKGEKGWRELGGGGVDGRGGRLGFGAAEDKEEGRRGGWLDGVPRHPMGKREAVTSLSCSVLG
jgi:hypothetical protein